MATIRSKVTQIFTDLESGKYNEEWLGLPTESSLTKAQTGHINKGWRAKILINRSGGPMPKITQSEISPRASKKRQLHYAKTDSFSQAQKEEYPNNYFENRISEARRRANLTSEDLSKSQDPDRVMKSLVEPAILPKAQNTDRVMKSLVEPAILPKAQNTSRAQAKIQIKRDQAIILVNTNVTPYQAIILQNRPDNIQVTPQSNWASVKSMGRNDPFMMYTGGETSINLEVSWYADDPQNYEEVVNKCRLLESWTKANGYSQAPPILNLIWGDSGLFEGQTFVLTAAPYNLNHFQAMASSEVSRKLLPSCATQTLTLKKVNTNNETWEELIPSSKLAKTKGIISEVLDPDEVAAEVLDEVDEIF